MTHVNYDLIKGQIKWRGTVNKTLLRSCRYGTMNTQLGKQTVGFFQLWSVLDSASINLSMLWCFSIVTLPNNRKGKEKENKKSVLTCLKRKRPPYCSSPNNTSSLTQEAHYLLNTLQGASQPPTHHMDTSRACNTNARIQSRKWAPKHPNLHPYVFQTMTWYPQRNICSCQRC